MEWYHYVVLLFAGLVFLALGLLGYRHKAFSSLELLAISALGFFCLAMFVTLVVSTKGVV